MTEKTRQFDVCIVCALWEEAEAVIKEFSARCKIKFESDYSKTDDYQYRYTTIQNNQDEPLTVLVTWLEGNGPVRTGLHLKPFLQEFHPRFAAMTGICAGYKEKVKLGDLVVAEYAYFYEEGKDTIGKDGQKKHEPQTRTYDATTQVIQYARGFEDWKGPVAKMKRPKMKLEESKDSEPSKEKPLKKPPECYIAPMASGMAVKADEPFSWLREYNNRKTLALEMETATFYLTLRVYFPEIHSLVVKGVSDYADGSKNDEYHEYAARASAVYLLYFIREHITEKTMPRRDEHQSQNRAFDRQAPIYDPAIPPQFTDPQDFVGRDELSAQLKQRLLGSESIVLTALCGLPGIGKTTLAVELIHARDVQEHFRDGILWAGVGKKTPNILGTLSRWGRLLGLSDTAMAKLHDNDAWALAIHTAIGTRQMLLVIDDVWRTEDVLAFQLGGSFCKYLITTRVPSIATHFVKEKVILVPELSEDDGVALLARFAPAVVQAELKAARELVQEVGGLPLALKLMGDYLLTETSHKQSRRIQAALEMLHNAKARLKLEEPQAGLKRHPSLSGETPISLQTVIGISDEALVDDALRQAFRALSVFPPKPNTFSEEAALAVAATPVEVLDQLVDAGLLEANKQDRYTLHQTIADYANINLTDMTSYERMVEFYVSFVGSHETDYKVVEREMSNISTALQTAFERKIYSALVRGANAFCSFLQPRGLYTLAADHLKRAEQAARSLGDTRGLVMTLVNLGEIAERRGDYGEAETQLQKALTQARQTDDNRLVGAVLRNLGNTERERGEYVKAEEHLQEGLTLARPIGDHVVISGLLSSLGAVANHRGGYMQAEAYLQEGLTIACQARHPHTGRISGLLTTLGDVVAHRGEYAQAEAYLQEGLTIARDSGHQAIICACLRNLGALAIQVGKYDQAEAYLQKGLTLARQVGHRGRVSGLLMNLGELATQRGEYTRAKSYLEEGLVLANQIGHRENMSGLLLNLGVLATQRGEYTRAKSYLEEGLVLANQIGHREKKSALLCSLGVVARDIGNYTQAEEYLQKGLALARQIGHYRLTASILNSWGELYLKQQLDSASEKFHEVVRMTEGVTREHIALARYGLARVAAAQNDTVEARQEGQESLTILAAIGHHKATEVEQWLSMLPQNE